MAEQKIKWTDQQLRAIITRGSDVLVTASAGTGKTAVLSGRYVDIVADKSICPDVWSILVLTFTDMAAEQMRSRIAEQLRDACAESKNPQIQQHLRHQLMLLQGADISTIHSFCKRLITGYFYKLGLDPTFSVIDSDETRLLKAEVLEKTIDWVWQQSDLQQALQQLLYRRDLRTALPRSGVLNDGFLAKIIELNDFLDSVLFRQSWYERAAQLAEVVNPFASELGKKQKQIIADRLQQIRARLYQAQKLYVKWDSGGNWAIKFKDIFIKPIEKCIELLESGDWDKCADMIRTFSKPRVTKPKELPRLGAELIQKIVKKAVDSFAELSELAILNPDYLDRISDSVSLQTNVLVKLVREFDRLYRKAKLAVNCLDFADLEHYALKLLTQQDSSQDNLIPSETALSLQSKYKYIFVDEFQDINPVQQAILEAISSGGNVFVVGDVKQSIYAFRGAEPEIFLQDLKSASVAPARPPIGLRVDLNVNFRSGQGILDFVNRIFSRIMTGCRFAGLDYDESAQLRPAAVRESHSSPDVHRDEAGARDRKNVVEFHIVDEADKEIESQSEFEIDENFGVVSPRQRQAAMIAQRIKKIVGAETDKPEFQIYDKQQNTFRDVEYRDIVILMRSLAKKANDYVEVLRLAGVPVSCQATAGYFETTEISDVLCLLKVLDNPQRDIEFAAVLRSPFFNISDTELAKIKIHSGVRHAVHDVGKKHRNFYYRVIEYSKTGADAKLAEKLKEILDQIEQWRTVARRGSLADLLWQIYRQTGFLSFVSALPNGQARRANLLKLHDRAIQFEGFVSSAGIPSLTRFVEFIEKLQETGQDWAPAEPQESVGNSVRILSVHKSKGLEFPVVFLAELESQFNKKDIYADVLANVSDTLGLQIIDRKSNSRLRSLAHEVIAEQKLSKTLAEEMRILYVATTRARDRLILTASQKRNICQDIIVNGYWLNPHAKDQSPITKSIPEWQLRDCQSPLEWILYALSDQKALHETFETELVKDACDDNLFSVKLYNQTELKQLSNFVLNLKAGKSVKAAVMPGESRSKRDQSKLLSQLKKSLAWQYGHGDAPLLPAKQSVTQLTHRNDEYVNFDYSRALQRQPAAVMAAEDGSVASSSAAARLSSPKSWGWLGTATHFVIAQLDLSRPINREAVEKVKEKLLADAAISEAVAETIETGSILAFFQGELGQMAVNKKNTVWREWPFTFALPVSVLRDAYCVLRCALITTHDAPRTPVPSEVEGTQDEIVVVQGIIDMLIRTPQGLVVIDFKTDNITSKQVPERAELYRRQLDIYARAASGILKEKLLAKWLYFLTPATEFEIK